MLDYATEVRPCMMYLMSSRLAGRQGGLVFGRQGLPAASRADPRRRIRRRRALRVLRTAGVQRCGAAVCRMRSLSSPVQSPRSGGVRLA